ncbi:DUF1254 domain-containing protein [Agromyces subbeticus]|uniref:DUF1254 domain-containing protein n=1 Tax=Agromyces subbeticus TaxID=293890 RepID=UPI00042919E8|nr:DUF1254 domain-containing protein [Agromyces subbeticus]
MTIERTIETNPADQKLAEEVSHVSTPDRLSTPFGEFEFFDGVPKPESVQSIFDGLDLVRGITAFLDTVPGASLVAMRRGLRTAGVDSPGKIGFTDPRCTSTPIFLTPNTETTYGVTFLDLKAWGPTVIEVPSQSLCVVDDFWFRYVADMGIAGPDRGAGGKYLFLPPGYDGERPDGYYTYESPTFTNFLVIRALGGVPAIKQSRIYRLSDAGTAPENTFVNIGEQAFNTVHSNDFSFFEEIAEIVTEEPTAALDPERAGALASLGIAHAKPFAPDARLRGILDDAARIGAAMARANLYAARNPDSFRWEGSSWKNGFVGGSYEFLNDGARNLDARTLFHYAATVIHAGDGARAGGRRLRLPLHGGGCRRCPARRGRDVLADDPRESAGEELLGRRHLRHADPIAAAIGAVPCAVEPARRAPDGRRRFVRAVVRTIRASGQGIQLDPDAAWQVVVAAAAAVRSARAVVRPDLATARDRAPAVLMPEAGQP